MWGTWWVWVAGGLAIGCLEVVLPGYIFLGFAIGAVLTGALIGLGPLTGTGLSTLLMVFAVVSLVAWIVLRLAMGRRPGQVRIWDRDINDPN